MKILNSITCSKCGAFLELDRIYKQSYCAVCHAEYMRDNRPKYSELKEDQKKKNIARSYAWVYVRRGTLVPKSCDNCGDPKAEMHHEDYSKPLDVNWLCRKCHLELHERRKLEEASKELGMQRK